MSRPEPTAADMLRDMAKHARDMAALHLPHDAERVRLLGLADTWEARAARIETEKSCA